MKIIKTKIKNLLLLKTNIFKDKRGFFKEVQKNNILKKKFVFDCFSFSKKTLFVVCTCKQKKVKQKSLLLFKEKF